MKFMTMVTTSNADKVGTNPPPALMEAIGQLGMQAGSRLRDTGGMKAVSDARVRQGELLVDGPYAEAKEAIGGYAVYELESEAEAVQWVRDFLELHRRHWPEWEGDVQLLQLLTMGPPQN